MQKSVFFPLALSYLTIIQAGGHEAFGNLSLATSTASKA